MEMCPNCYQNTRDETITHKCSNCGKLLERTRWTEIVDGIEIKVKRSGFTYYHSFIQNIDGVDINWEKTYNTYRNSDRRETIYTKKSWTTLKNGEEIEWAVIDDHMPVTHDRWNASIPKREKFTVKYRYSGAAKIPILHGLCQKWVYGNGRLESETCYEDDLRHGKHYYYGSSGISYDGGGSYVDEPYTKEGYYINDKRHGEWKIFQGFPWSAKFDKNKVISIENFENGKRDGPLISYYRNGKKSQDGLYKDDKAYGLWTYYSPDGKESSELIYKDGKQDGLLIDWYENGQKKLERPFKDGKQDGLFTYWYKNGLKERQGKLKDGKRDGLWTNWHNDGVKKEEEIFKNDEKISSKCWDEDGTVKE